MALPAASPADVASLPISHALFGVLVHGRLVTTAVHVVSQAQFFVDLPAPGTAADVSVFLLPTIPLPPTHGVIVQVSRPSEDGAPVFATIGTLHAGVPSFVVHTGWPVDAAMRSLPFVRLLLTVLPLEEVTSASSALTARDWDKVAFAQLVARDLHRFLVSCSQTTAVGERLVLPTDVIDQWYSKFEGKFKRDPNFLLRPASDA